MDVREDIAAWKQLMLQRVDAAEARAREAEVDRERMRRRLADANTEIERLVRRCHCQ